MIAVDIEQRILNFKNMAQADPDNELGHFSLGKAYFEAGRFEEAVAALHKVIELNGGFSKAYQILGEAQKNLGRTDDAVATLQKGREVAARQGDIKPRDAMSKLLLELGRELPTVESKEEPVPQVGGDTVRCSRCGRTASKIPQRPFKGPLGERVFASVCNACWQEWLAMGTKVINELQLDFSNPQAGDIYDSHLKEFLQLRD